MQPGETLLAENDIDANCDRPTNRTWVAHTGDRPIQVGSHFHFFEVNRELQFDRPAAYGMRLNIAAGTAVRFEPGEEKEVELVPFGGNRSMFGHNALVQGSLDRDQTKAAALELMADWTQK